jgi:hypothetical protein
MRAFAKALILICLGAVTTAAAPAPRPELGVVPAKTILPAATACLRIKPDLSAKRQQLVAEGWSREERPRPDLDGYHRPGVSEAYHRDGIMLFLSAERPICEILAKVDPSTQVDGVSRQLSRAFGDPLISSAKGAAWLLANGQSVALTMPRSNREAFVKLFFTPETESPQKKKR